MPYGAAGFAGWENPGYFIQSRRGSDEYDYSPCLFLPLLHCPRQFLFFYYDANVGDYRRWHCCYEWRAAEVRHGK